MSANLADASTTPIPLRDHVLHSTDEAAFQTLYQATARPLLAYLLGVTGRRDVADDLLQDTFCRFLIRRPGAMPLDDTRRYLFRVATNLLRDRWRHASGSEGQPSPHPVDPSVSTDLNLQLDVRRVLATLKPRHRELLWLAYVEGMSHAEIATVTGLTALSIRLLLFRARKHAAALLQPHQETV